MSVIVDFINYFVANPGFLIIGALLYVFIFALSLFFTKPAPGKNPFKYDLRKEQKPLVTDQKIRDGVIKQGFVPKRVPEKIDVIVVGSGIGGLSVAAMLAKAGKKVVVLEQHDQAGGCCHTYIEKGFEFDVGIHYIGEMRNNTVSKLLIDQLTEGQLTWEPLVDDFDVIAIGEPGKQKMYPFVCGSAEKWKTSMIKQFPSEEKAINKYLELVQNVRKEMLGMVAAKTMSRWLVRFLINTGLVNKFTKYFQYSQKTVQQVLDELTTNEELKAVLGYNFGDYGTLPRSASFACHATLLNHVLYGAAYPRGGASEIAYHMIPVIERAGGRVLVRAPVSQILTDAAGKVTGVRVARPSGDVDVSAPIVISNAGLINTYQSLLPPEVAQKSHLSKFINKKVKSGIGAMSLFVGLNGTQEELQLKQHNIWAFTGADIDQISADYFEKSAEEAIESDVPLLFITFPSTKDPTFNQPDRFPGKSVCTVITLARWEWFEQWQDERVKKRGDDYESFKNAIGKRIWQQVLALYPHLEDKVEYFEVGSPVTNRYYIGSARGEIYGLDHDTSRFSPEVVMSLRPETDIPGLYLTGQDVFSGGFMGACFGGVLCASKVLHRDVYTDLVKLKKTVSKSK